MQRDVKFVIAGPFNTVSWWNESIGLGLPLYEMTDPDDHRPIGIGVWSSISTSNYTPEPGKTSQEAGSIATLAIKDAVWLCLQGVTRGMTTAPINKESFTLAGSRHPGHTEYLAELAGVPEEDVLMMLTDESLRVALTTIHIPIADVAGNMSEPKVFDTINTLHKSMVRLYKIASPKIHVLGLNPHAGDGGVIGSEEASIIEPAIRRSVAAGIDAAGPFPADAYFGMRRWQNCDVVLAMYHDQGLIPIKMLSFDKGVNITLGLPFVRTSPDHGTAFDIAGKNIASPTSFMHAVSLVNRLTSH
jgi:4-hydroxythreonine-4-phosphate dehydrogenase